MRTPGRAQQSVQQMPGTKHLFILRHAKSSWDDPGLHDHQRPLAPRGRRAVQLLHTYVRVHKIEPSLVLCSSARRTQETLDGVAPAGQSVIEPELYSASAGGLLDRIRRIPADTPSAMMIGHNPAMQMLVLRLAAPPHTTVRDEESDLATVQRKFPTGTLATITFECEWQDLAAGAGVLTGLVRPKDLNLTPRVPTLG
jgi:phosphohistidine phosphatase